MGWVTITGSKFAFKGLGSDIVMLILFIGGVGVFNVNA